MRENTKGESVFVSHSFFFGVLLLLAVLFIVFILVVPRISYHEYDEVMYDCGSHLVKGTEVPNSIWDLEGGVDVYYFYSDNDSVRDKRYEVPLRSWFKNFDDVELKKGEGDCKEILRFYEKK